MEVPFVTLTPVLRGLRNRCASIPPHHTLTRLESGVLNYRNILYNSDVLLTVHLSIILVINQLNAQILHL